MFVQGFALIPDALDDVTVDALLETVAPLHVEGAAGARNLLDVSAIQTLARSAPVRALVEPLLGPHCFAVRGIYFDKTATANWKVPFHQDLSIAVQARRDVEGYGPWSNKAGALHVQPPREVLEQMLTLRLHLDDCNAENGALRVLPGSHEAGKLSASTIARWRETRDEIICALPRGGALLMRPLLLHASSPALAPTHRRVVHLEWAARPLPGGLNWRHRVAKTPPA